MKKISFFTISIFLVIIATIFTFEIGLRIHKYAFAKNDKVAFYVFGGSTSFGEPFYDNPSFIRIINKKLQGKFNDKNIKIVMFASPGKNLISNYLSLAKEIIKDPYEEIYSFVYMGINESHINEYGIFYDALEKILLNFYIGPFILDFFLPNEFHLLPNSPNLFEVRYEKFLSFISSNSKKVFLSSLAGNFHEYQPSFSNYKYKDINGLFACESQHNEKERLDCFKKIENKPEFVKFLIKLLSFKITGDIKYLDQMKLHWNKFESHVPSELKNLIIKGLSKKFENINYVPFYEEIQNRSSGLIGYNYFVDAHHPNLETMLIMTNLFYKSLTGVEGKITVQDTEDWFFISHRFKDIAYSRLQWFFWESLFDFVSFSKARSYYNYLTNNKHLFKKEEIEFFNCLLYLIGPNFSQGSCKDGKLSENYKESFINNFFERDFVVNKIKNFNDLYLNHQIINSSRHEKVNNILK